MDCAGIPGLQCLDDPHLQTTSPTLTGYRDVPCDGEPPAGCVSPVPPPDAAGHAPWLDDLDGTHTDDAPSGVESFGAPARFAEWEQDDVATRAR